MLQNIEHSAYSHNVNHVTVIIKNILCKNWGRSQPYSCVVMAWRVTFSWIQRDLVVVIIVLVHLWWASKPTATVWKVNLSRNSSSTLLLQSQLSSAVEFYLKQFQIFVIVVGSSGLRNNTTCVRQLSQIIQAKINSFFWTRRVHTSDEFILQVFPKEHLGVLCSVILGVILLVEYFVNLFCNSESI